MSASARWDEWYPKYAAPESEVRRLVAGVMGLHSTFTNEIWLWRGQADAKYGLEPGMHSRIRNSPGLALDDANVWWATRQLLELARANELDRIEGLRLPDLALLAHLQHHGAATPLLDVTVDPLVALWMAVHASGPSEDALDDRAALLLAVRRPAPEDWLDALDSRSFWTGTSSDVVTDIGDRVKWFRPPDVSERLRIQRGSFLLGRLADPSALTTLPLVHVSGKPWLKKRIEGLGKPGQPVKADSEVVAFRIRAALKPLLREWLADRAGLSQQVIYPTPWHRPFLDQFCQAYDRVRPVDH